MIETPEPDYDDPALYPFDGMMPPCGFIVHWAQCRLDAGHNGRHSPGRLPAEAASPAAPVCCTEPQDHARHVAEAQGGAPRAEELDREVLLRIIRLLDEDHCSEALEVAVASFARLSRPSDERVPESEEET